MNTQQWVEFQSLVERTIKTLSQRFRRRLRRLTITPEYREKMTQLLQTRVPDSYIVGIGYFRTLYVRYKLRQVLVAPSYGDAENQLMKLSDSMHKLSTTTRNDNTRRVATTLSIRLHEVAQGTMAFSTCHWAHFTSIRLARFLRENSLDDQEIHRLLELVGNIQLNNTTADITIARTAVRSQLESLSDYTLRKYCVDFSPV